MITKKDETFSNALQNILNNNQNYLLTSEISNGVNHYFLNIITAILLQIDLLNMNDKNGIHSKGLSAIEKSINEIVDMIKKIRELKYCESNVNIPIDVNTETIDQIILLKDFFNTHGIQISCSSSILSSSSCNKCIIQSLFFNVLMFMFHSSEGNKNKINIELSEENAEFLFFFSMDNANNDDISNENKIDNNRLFNDFQIVYWKLIKNNLIELNGDHFINYNGNVIELSFIIPIVNK